MPNSDPAAGVDRTRGKCRFAARTQPEYEPPVRQHRRRPLRESSIPPHFQQRVKNAAKKFGDDFGLPHIIALQEVENLYVLQQIAAEIRDRYRLQTIV